MKPRITGYALALIGSALGIVAEAREPDSSAEELMGFTSATVGVRDLDAALELWVDTFGFEIAARRDGPDEALGHLWAIDPANIARQVLLVTDDSGYGRLHLVEYVNPGPSVRDGANVYDRLPKNLDVYVDDLPRRHRELLDAGYTFLADRPSEVAAPDGTLFREIHMPSHDDVNVVLLEVVGQPGRFTPQGYWGIAPLIFIVDDAVSEKQFFADVLEFDKLSDNLLKGPEIEKMIGLPPGAGLDVSIWGRSDVELGGLEIVEYQGVEGENRYPLARPGSRGILHVSLVLADSTAIRQRLAAAGVDVEHAGRGNTLIADGELYRFRTPGGLVIELWDTGGD